MLHLCNAITVVQSFALLIAVQIRPIDKKCGYQIDRLLAAAASDSAKGQTTEDTAEAMEKSKDLLRYRPNPEMLVSKTDMAADVSIFATSA